jgi:hypothetical protein
VEFRYKFEKNILFPLVAAVAQHHNALQSFWQRMSHIKGIHVHVHDKNGILQFKQNSNPLSVPNNICDCMQSHNSSKDIPVDPPFFWLDDNYTYSERF